MSFFDDKHLTWAWRARVVSIHHHWKYVDSGGTTIYALDIFYTNNFKPFLSVFIVMLYSPNKFSFTIRHVILISSVETDTMPFFSYSRIPNPSNMGRHGIDRCLYGRTTFMFSCTTNACFPSTLDNCISFFQTFSPSLACHIYYINALISSLVYVFSYMLSCHLTYMLTSHISYRFLFSLSPLSLISLLFCWNFDSRRKQGGVGQVEREDPDQWNRIVNY